MVHEIGHRLVVRNTWGLEWDKSEAWKCGLGCGQKAEQDCEGCEHGHIGPRCRVISLVPHLTVSVHVIVSICVYEHSLWLWICEQIHKVICICTSAIHIHTHPNINTYTYVCTYIHEYIRTYMNTHIHAYIHTYMHTYTHTCIHTHTWIRVMNSYLSTAGLPLLIGVSTTRQFSGRSVGVHMNEYLYAFNIRMSSFICGWSRWRGVHTTRQFLPGALIQGCMYMWYVFVFCCVYICVGLYAVVDCVIKTHRTCMHTRINLIRRCIRCMKIHPHV